jgi:hypothetical protein
VRDVVGPDRLWQLHYAVDGGTEHNVDGRFIANQGESDDHGNYIKALAYPTGPFGIINSGNNLTWMFGFKDGRSEF